MKPVDVKSRTFINFNKKNNHEDPKTFLQKVMFKIGLKKFFLLKKLKILWRGHI